MSLAPTSALVRGKHPHGEPPVQHHVFARSHSPADRTTLNIGTNIPRCSEVYLVGLHRLTSCGLTILRISEPAPVVFRMQPRRDRGVRCIRLVSRLDSPATCVCGIRGRWLDKNSK